MIKQNEKEVAIEVENIHKNFILSKNKNSTLKQAMVNMVKKDNKIIYKVLDGISFEVNKGDFFGIVGRNGSGKSTLLKILAGVYEPTSGSVKTNGRLIPFIELGVGFNYEISGRDNVFLNGALLGFSRKQMAAMYDEIVEFAELEPFMDQKLKNYSSGMQVRLAFSIAIKAQGDILVLDEVLAVGDEAFQRKCFKYFAELKRDKKTVILVTHSMENVRQFCNKAILIEGGKIIDSGNACEVAQHYSNLFLPEAQSKKESNPIDQNNLFNIKTNFHKTNEKLNFLISLIPQKNFEDAVLETYISRDDGEIIWRWASDDKITLNKNLDINLKKNKKLDLGIELDNILPDSEFTMTLSIRRRDKSVQYAQYSDIIHFNNNISLFYDRFWKMHESINVSYGK